MKKSFFPCLALSMLLLLPCFALAGWERTYGKGAAYSVQQTSDGGYVAVGEIANGFGDVYLLKTDVQGETIWTQTYGDTLELVEDIGKCVRETTDGGYVIIGYTGGFDGTDSLLLVKTDEIGDTVWTRKFGSYYPSQGNFVEQTSDGGYIMTGFVDILGPEYTNLWLLKTDSTGDTLWTRTYGGTAPDGGYCVHETSDKDYIVVGFKGDEEEGYRSLWLLKTDSLGDTMWTRTYGGFPESSGHCVQETSDGGYVAVGYQDVAPGYGYIYLLKTDKVGNMKWKRTYPYAGDVFGYQYYVQQTSDGGYIITGTVMFLIPPTQEQIILLKTDSQGYQEWIHYYGEEVGKDWGYCVQQASDGGYVIAGQSVFGEDPHNNFCLIKTDTNGTLAVQEKLIELKRNFEVVTLIGSNIFIRYKDSPNGFHASIFDASGRKVDEIKASGSSGTITWGEEHTAGVYFIRSDSGGSTVTQRVVLLK